MLKKNFKKIISIVLLVVIFFILAAVGVNAQETSNAGSVIQSSIKNTARHAQLSNDSNIDLSTFIGRVIKNLLGLLGTVFLILVLYAGFMWMTAAGNEERVGKAKKILANSVIGLAVVILAYVIVEFVLRTFVDSGL